MLLYVGAPEPAGHVVPSSDDLVDEANPTVWDLLLRRDGAHCSETRCISLH